MSGPAVDFPPLACPTCSSDKCEVSLAPAMVRLIAKRGAKLARVLSRSSHTKGSGLPKPCDL
jgi:hypothetical protein